MNNIEQKLVQKAQAIFDTFDKWNAFLEIEHLRGAITERWFEIGTKKLREYFTQNHSEGWRWKEWDNARDTKWYLEEYGPDSLVVGFGWRYELHLYLKEGEQFDTSTVDKLLQTSKYAKLIAPFGPNAIFNGGSGSRVKDSNFDFAFNSINDGDIPQDELAWYAAHQTDEFVRQAASKIEQFTRNEEMTYLIASLNAEAKRKN